MGGVGRVCDVREWLVGCRVVHCVFRVVEWGSVYGIVYADGIGWECVGIVVHCERDVGLCGSCFRWLWSIHVYWLVCLLLWIRIDAMTTPILLSLTMHH